MAMLTDYGVTFLGAARRHGSRCSLLEVYGWQKGLVRMVFRRILHHKG